MTLTPYRPGALLLALSASLLPLIASSAPAAALADPVPRPHRHQHTADEITSTPSRPTSASTPGRSRSTT
ncbi:hypothetical protein AB0D45_14585 [Streptomyces sp. NPDC048352]|uniref:hypothetical protein n=1 Tax=Streptomyces sp. NPDC048352 TaxID=3154718 RepID=UPI00342C600F